MSTTVTTSRTTYLLDIDPYGDDITLAHGPVVEHFATSAEAIAALAAWVADDAAFALAQAPWVEV